MLQRRQSTTHRNLLRLVQSTKNQEAGEYIDLQNWLNLHKSSFIKNIDDKAFSKEKNGTAPIVYENRTSWEMMLNSISNPRSAEGRQWWNEIRNWQKGQNNEQKSGYQYEYGDNFPVIFKQKKIDLTAKRDAERKIKQM